MEQFNYFSFHMNKILLHFKKANVTSKHIHNTANSEGLRMQNRVCQCKQHIFISSYSTSQTVYGCWKQRHMGSADCALVRDISHHYHPLLNMLHFSPQTWLTNHTCHWAGPQRHSVWLNRGTSVCSSVIFTLRFTRWFGIKSVLLYVLITTTTCHWKYWCCAKKTVWKHLAC